ncbi:MAG: hypothetical protein CVU56_10515 [Deltaproteobacteria bacterium HGW-Deltaproteobacteria-14]|nr:MAG: hypothetical protein CVU56_10515 [Deltaproteobacteria bacterium HGW-Deltaproteobacteria-14]
MNGRVVLVCSFVFGSLGVVGGAARADLPDIPDALVEGVCGVAKAQDACPECKCEPLTSTSPTPEAESSDIRYAIALRVFGTDAQGREIENAHVALGAAEGLVHAGRVVAQTQDNQNGIDAQVVASGEGQRHDFCPGACEHDAVGLVHFFTLSTMWTNQDIAGDRFITRETDVVVACFAPDGRDRAACYGVPVAGSEEVTTVPGGPGQGPKPIRKRGWKRTWKIADKGGVHLALGAVEGKGEGIPAKKKATKVWMTQLPTFGGATVAPR